MLFPAAFRCLFADVLVFRDDIILVAGYLDPPVAILQAVFLNGLVTRYLVRFIQQSAACFMLIYTLIRHLLGHTVSGWTSLAVSILALGGIQLLAIGTIGEYMGKIYLETKHHPVFLISDYLTDDDRPPK